VHLQTKTKKEAKDITMQEANDIVKELLAVLSDKKLEQQYVMFLVLVQLRIAGV
jgi:hypothetical protein